jgi:predicted NBD/HSP70 family sugar kinase
LIAEESVTYLKDSLAKGIFNLMMVLDPECVLIGGAIAARESFVPEIKQRVKEYTVKNRANGVRTPISRCSFSKEANLVGAIFHYLAVRVGA